MKLTATAAAILVALSALAPSGVLAADGETTVTHGLTLVGKLKYPPDFRHLDYVNPDAPRGGVLRQHAIGTFDSFNPFSIRGTPAAGLGFVYETLLASAPDEISAEYGAIAESVEVPGDLSWVLYTLRPEARFHDGTPITVEDVIWSLNALKEKGRPHFRFYYKNIARAVKVGERKVKFELSGPPNRELPQITGQLPVLSRKWWAERPLDRTTLDPLLGSGPYRIAAFETGRFVELERVPDWWGAALPINRGRYNFDRIRIDYYRDQTVAQEAFKADRYDYRIENNSLIWATAYDFPARRDGRVNLEQVPHRRPTGMQAFVFNLRRPQFTDPVLREAMAFAFDFEWSNRNLFYGQYARTKSFFSNSELAARMPPSPEELALLEPWRGRIPDEVFSEVYEPPSTEGSGNIRRNLGKALKLLKGNGYRISENRLISPVTSKPVSFEILLVSPAFERIVTPFARNLKRLGIDASVRTVDQSQYINRLNAFDFDMIVGGAGQSESPGNEQRDYWSSAAAGRQGSRNHGGISNPAVDDLIEKIIAAPTRAGVVTATRALDRVLLWNHYVIPQWHIRMTRLAYWNRFGIPGHPAYGPDITSWWHEGGKAAHK